MKSADTFAIAIDLGTTTLAGSLVNWVNGERIAALSALNPQREYGSDVVARLDAACRSDESLGRMQRLVAEELERLAVELIATAGIAASQVTMVAIAGNPAMEHLLLGLPVRSLAFPPYRPLFSAGRRESSSSLGWKLDVPLYLFPLPGGFVGGDTVAFLYGCADSSTLALFPTLYLDLGTNGEIALKDGDRVFATSAAAGPAFEGGNLACGMVALPGAISGVELDGERLKLAVIGGGMPTGICGSGVLDTISLLLETGVIDRTGRILPREEIPSNLANRVEEIGGSAAFVLYRDAKITVYLGQEDLRQVQLAKGALRAGMEVLFAKSGKGHDAVGGIVLTGSFGAILKPSSLKNIGILPEKMVEITGFVREGALAGVERALFANDDFAGVETLAVSMKVVPLSGSPAFEKHFIEQMNF